MNKEVLFAQILEQVRKTAKEQGNCISEEQVKDAFAELDLSGEQLQMVFDYLLKHKIGIGQPMDPDEFLTDEERIIYRNIWTRWRSYPPTLMGRSWHLLCLPWQVRRMRSSA